MYKFYNLSTKWHIGNDTTADIDNIKKRISKSDDVDFINKDIGKLIDIKQVEEYGVLVIEIEHSVLIRQSVVKETPGNSLGGSSDIKDKWDFAPYLFINNPEEKKLRFDNSIMLDESQHLSEKHSNKKYGFDIINSNSVKTFDCNPLSQCPSCNGSRSCSSCNGHGRLRCGSCNNSGRCSQCKGRGRENCTFCSGTGYNLNTKCMNCNGTGIKSCFWCNGSGVCKKCSGSGWVSCGSCGGTGRCRTCNGSGSITCQRCNGTGNYQVFDVCTNKLEFVNNRHITSDSSDNKSVKSILKSITNNLTKLGEINTSSYYIGNSYFDNKGSFVHITDQMIDTLENKILVDLEKTTKPSDEISFKLSPYVSAFMDDLKNIRERLSKLDKENARISHIAVRIYQFNYHLIDYIVDKPGRLIILPNNQIIHLKKGYNRLANFHFLAQSIFRTTKMDIKAKDTIVGIILTNLPDSSLDINSFHEQISQITTSNYGGSGQIKLDSSKVLKGLPVYFQDTLLMIVYHIYSITRQHDVKVKYDELTSIIKPKSKRQQVIESKVHVNISNSENNLSCYLPEEIPRWFNIVRIFLFVSLIAIIILSYYVFFQ